MESVSQFVLGASVAAVALGNRTAAWKALLWGGVVGSLPDLDVLIDHGDPIANMVLHRAESHALFWLSAVSPVLAVAIAALHRELALLARWWLAVWLALVTHPLLDAMTIYGTRLLLPFHDHPFGTGSLFVIDPLYTLPLLIGNVVLLASRGSARGRRWNVAGLVLSTAYAAWSLVAQQLALHSTRESLAARGIVADRVVATAGPLQTVLWRVLALTDTHVYEGHWSLLDDDAPIDFVAIDRGVELRRALAGTPHVARLLHFSHDTCKFTRQGDEVRVTDVRMGQEPYYMFTFAVGQVTADGRVVPLAVPIWRRERIPFGPAWRWLWPRLRGERVPMPH